MVTSETLCGAKRNKKFDEKTQDEQIETLCQEVRSLRQMIHYFRNDLDALRNHSHDKLGQPVNRVDFCRGSVAQGYSPLD